MNNNGQLGNNQASEMQILQAYCEHQIQAQKSISNEYRSESVDTPTPKFVKDAQNNAPHIIRKQDM